MKIYDLLLINNELVELKHEAKSVYKILATLAEHASLSYRFIAEFDEESGLDESLVKKDVKELLENKIIEKEITARNEHQFYYSHQRLRHAYG